MSDGTARPKTGERLYELVTGEDDARLCRDIPDAQCNEQPRSFLCQVAAQALSKTGDAFADSKIVLPWLIGVVGAPAWILGVLVPIRESLALLPQIIVGSIIRRFAVRKWFWVLSSLVDGLCVAAMGLVGALGMRGAAAGWAILALLVLFSVARGVASIAAKDTLGKTVSKGRRGRVSGYAATLSGITAAAVGLYLVLGPEAARPDWLLYALLIAAGGCWGAAAFSFSLIVEHPGATEGGRGIDDIAREQWALLMQDRDLRLFLLARALMISTALMGPIVVALAQSGAGTSLGSLGWLVLATALATTLSSAFWGVLSDRSSRVTMALGASFAGAVGLLVLAAAWWAPRLTANIAGFAGAIFLLGIAHAGVRIGRKTHIVDLAGGDRKADYVAVSNTITGVLLLVVGAVTGALLAAGLDVALAVLVILAFAGAAVALAMKDVQD